MSVYRLPYGRAVLDCDLATAQRAGHQVELIEPASAEPLDHAPAAIAAAIAAAQLPAYRGGGCAIAINDRTRPVPHAQLLPPLIERLGRAGVPDHEIVFLIATGTHAPMPIEQFGDVVPPEILSRFRVISHDARDEAGLVLLGETTRGTPILINREYCARALRVVVGVIEPHQFVGFSGGVKSAAIGLAGYPTVKHNHSMMSERFAQLGRYDDNPCRQDIEQIGARIGIHLALNVVLGEAKRILAVLAGPPLEVMRQGIPLVCRFNQVEVKAPFDLTIVSPGGHPKDVNLYQAQKALAHAALVTRPGGTVLLAAACPDGTGSEAYESWIRDPSMTSHAAVLERFAREGYGIGPHKAFQISRDASRVTVRLHSTMAPALVAQLLLEPEADFQAAVSRAVRDLPPRSRIGVMPRANATIPILREPRAGA
jgi:nickel-dependent lactate racemase